MPPTARSQLHTVRINTEISVSLVVMSQVVVTLGSWKILIKIKAARANFTSAYSAIT